MGPHDRSVCRNARKRRSLVSLILYPFAFAVGRGHYLTVLALAVVLFSCSSAETSRSVVLVVIDTLRADHLGTYGYTREVSTLLDARAESAVVFEQAMSTSPWTLPSMGSLLTGRYPAHHGAGSRSELAQEPSKRSFASARKTRRYGTFSRLRGDVPVLAQTLSEAGFATSVMVSPMAISRIVLMFAMT